MWVVRKKSGRFYQQIFMRIVRPKSARRENITKQKLINEVNDVLKERCVVYGFDFINNSNIKREHLWKDGTHLVEEGKIILANNYIKCLNNFLCQVPQMLAHR